MPTDVDEPHAPPPDGHPGPGDAPPPALGPGSVSSSDDLSVILTHGRPDPMLGEVAAAPESPRADALNELSAIDVGGAPPAEIPLSSSDALAAIAVDTGAPPRGAVAPRAEPGPDESDEPPPGGVPLGTVLLASYASAVTLGLAWVLWTGRKAREAVVEPEAPTPAAFAGRDPGRRADRSRRVVPPPPIAADHLTTLGKPVRLGVIEATPLSVASASVTLVREFTTRQTKPGGRNALRLRLRLKNVSTDTVLAPLDEGFIRTRERDDPDSFIETTQGKPEVGMYPLAVESEWTIAGQSFAELRPGESAETDVVSAPDASLGANPEVIWRVRLRTDVNHTDDLGVRFRADDVKVVKDPPKPAPKAKDAAAPAPVNAGPTR